MKFVLMTRNCQIDNTIGVAASLLEYFSWKILPGFTDYANRQFLPIAVMSLVVDVYVVLYQIGFECFRIGTILALDVST